VVAAFERGERAAAAHCMEVTKGGRARKNSFTWGKRLLPPTKSSSEATASGHTTKNLRGKGRKEKIDSAIGRRGHWWTEILSGKKISFSIGGASGGTRSGEGEA